MVPRRDFLKVSAQVGVASASASLLVRPSAGQPTETSPFSFFVVGDTHYLAEKENPGSINEASATICGRLVDTMNRLPGTVIPMEAGGGEVLKPEGVIHAGDVIDTGDKQGGTTAEMQKTEWRSFERDYGLTGRDGRLKYPVYEVYGNHDSPRGDGYAIGKIIERNRNRPGLVARSQNGLHYSWNWGNVHFINLGITVAASPKVDRRRRYGALDSFAFLQQDLANNVASAKQPIVITHHIDVARYTGPCDAAAAYSDKEWDSCDVHAYFDAIKNHNVIGIFYGHTHVRNVLRWDGAKATPPQPNQETKGLPLFNTDNGSHFSGEAQAIFYVEVHSKELVVREYQTKDRWQTGFFTPIAWRVPYSA